MMNRHQLRLLMRDVPLVVEGWEPESLPAVWPVLASNSDERVVSSSHKLLNGIGGNDDGPHGGAAQAYV